MTYATECSECGSPQVDWFIRDKAYCDRCAHARFEIQDHPFDEDEGD